MLKSLNNKYLIGIIVILHVVGVFGLHSPYQSIFIALTPVNLLICLWFLFSKDQNDPKPLVYFILIAFTIGFFAEVLGVNYGIIFGSYSYGPALGFKLFGVPLMIGLNWIMVVYCGMAISESITRNSLLQMLLTAVLATLLDLVMEPGATHLNFWNWNAASIPITNYLGWFGISLIIAVFYKFMNITSRNNPIAIPLFLTQFIFFLVIWLFR